MTAFTPRRIRFRNGDRHSLLRGAHGLPVHEVTLFLGGYRTRGVAANTIHYVCTALSVLYKALARAEIDLLDRLRRGQFLTQVELSRIVTAAQHHISSQDNEAVLASKSVVVNLNNVRMRAATADQTVASNDTKTFGSRLRYIALFLEFLVDYFKVDLSPNSRIELEDLSADILKKFRAQIPNDSKREKLGARQGLSKEEQDRLLAVIRPGSPDNPWTRGFVQRRNQLIVMILLATGMRRGELLGMQIGDLDPRTAVLRVVRRADSQADTRTEQQVAKTSERELELLPSLMQCIWDYVAERKKIRRARKHPMLIVSEDGDPLSSSAMNKIFSELRQACPGLPVRLTSHVMRHSWNERFSEEGDAMGLSEVEEQRARNEQQGWSANSKMAATYTRRHTNRKGREIALRLQEKLDADAN